MSGADDFMIVPVERYELRRKESGGLIRRVGTFEKREAAELFRDQLIAMDTTEDKPVE